MGRPYRHGSTNPRAAAEKRGRRAEWLAGWVLRLKGYRILETRWKTRLGEIDIIAQKGAMLVFVEVKARPNHAQATEAVTYQNRRRIERAADLYAATKRLTPLPTYRFDIVTISGFKWVHIHNAWRSGE
jgi:putative endonuclease